MKEIYDFQKFIGPSVANDTFNVHHHSSPKLKNHVQSKFTHKRD